MRIRELLVERPMLGWVLAALLLLAACVLGFRSLGSKASPYTFDRLTEDVVIKDRETGEEWTMKRGRMEAILWDRGGVLDPNVGIPNPKTGKPNGFPKSDWEATIDRITHDRAAAVEAYGGQVPTSSSSKPARKTTAR